MNRLTTSRQKTEEEVEMAAWGAVEVDGQLVTYEWLQIDVRSDAQRQTDAAAGHLHGDPAVVIPGHVQTVASPRKLTEAAAKLSSAGVAWCIDILPPSGGDPVKGRALGPIVRARTAALLPPSARPESAPAQPARATLIGWSHGGGEALRSAEHDPDLFARVAGLCPAGLSERRLRDLLAGFLSEVMRIVWNALVRRDGPGLRDAFRVGFDILVGMARDMIRSRSAQRVIDDIRWASRKVPGPGFGYCGDVAIIFARNDTVIRWQAVFPGCVTIEEIPAHLEPYRLADFPKAARLRVTVLEGDHLSPEHAAAEYARAAFALLGLTAAEAESGASG
jgi:pimeloyl-ACP methyl ester carboxylesterase